VKYRVALNIGLETPKAVAMKGGLVGCNATARRFGGTYCLNFQGRNIRQARHQPKQAN
jgi:hypothetical protein